MIWNTLLTDTIRKFLKPDKGISGMTFHDLGPGPIKDVQQISHICLLSTGPIRIRNRASAP